MLGLLTVVSVPALVDVLIERSAGDGGLQIAIAAAAVGVPAVLFVIVDTAAARMPRSARRSIRHARRAWADRVSRAMEARSTTLSDLAAAIDVSAVELGFWLRGWRDPDPRRMARLADVLELSPVVLLEDLHYLPLGTYSRLMAVESTREQVRRVINHQSELDRELGSDWAGRSSLIVGSLLSSANADRAGAWAVLTSLRPRGQGAAKVDDFHEYVAFVGGSDRSSGSRRQQLERLVGSALCKVSAHWEDSTELIESFFQELTGSEQAAATLASRSEVAIIPRLLATRAPRLSVDRTDPDLWSSRRGPAGGPAVLVVLGLHHSGSADIGALIAREWDYGYCQLSNFAMQVYGRSSARTSRYELELAEWFVGNSFDAGHRWVVVPNEYEAVEQLPRQLLRRPSDFAPSDLAVVLLDSDDNLLRYTQGRSLIKRARDEAGEGVIDLVREQDRRFVDASGRLDRVRSCVEALARRGAAVVIEPVEAPRCRHEGNGDERYGSRDLRGVDDPLYGDDADGFFSSYFTSYRRVVNRLDSIFTH